MSGGYGRPLVTSSPSLLAAADGTPTLIVNNDPAVTVWVSDDKFGVEAGDETGSAPLPPLATYASDGSREVWGVTAPGQSAKVSTYPGGQSFFQLVELLVKTLLVSATAGNGLFVYSGAPGSGDLIASIVGTAGNDPFGNFANLGIASYGKSGADTLTCQINGATISLFFDAALRMFMSNGGVFAFNPQGQAGGLIASIAQGAFTDQYGNAVLEAISAYAPNNTGANFAIQMLNNSLVWYSGPANSNGAGPWSQIGALAVDITGTQLQISGFTNLATVPIINANLTGQAVVGTTGAPGSSATLEVHSLLGLAQRAAPGTPPAGFGYLYVSSADGSLHYKGSAGTDTKLAVA